MACTEKAPLPPSPSKDQDPKKKSDSKLTDWWICGWSTAHCTCCTSDKVEPLVLLQLREGVESNTKSWMMRLLSKPQVHGGAGLLVHPGEDDSSDVILLSAPGCTLCQATEELGLCRPDQDGNMAAFSCHNKQRFKHSDNMQEFLTLAERHYIVKYMLESLRALEAKRIPGVPAPLGLLKPRDNIFQRLQKAGLVVDMLPLHEHKQLSALKKEWYTQARLTAQPLDQIQSYFGSSVAFYFSFLDFYTLALIPMAILGTVLALMPPETAQAAAGAVAANDALESKADLEWVSPGGLLGMGLLSMLWSSLLLELWKRRSASLAYRWGTNHLAERFAEPRPNYHGELGINPVTGRQELLFPAWKCQLRLGLVSVPVVLLFLKLVLLGMAGFYWAERWVRDWTGTSEDPNRSQSLVTTTLLYLPSIGHIVYTNILGTAYGKVALALTEWENHREESSFQNHHTTKVLVFTFFNCFAVLFHIAFVKQDLPLLRKRLSSLLIINQLINQMSEVVVPYLVDRYFNPPELREKENDPEVDAILAQSDLPTFPGLFYEYIELLVQFGYLSLFSCVYPLTALFLLLNNITELRTDAYKICNLFRKPFTQPTASMGVWQPAFEILGFMSVMSNCWLVLMSPRLQEFSKDAGFSSTQLLVLAVLVEHILIIVKLVVAFIIPDEPDWVRIQREKIEFRSMQALGQQKL